MDQWGYPQAPMPGAPDPFVRDVLDQSRMRTRNARVPSAEYPDGYLGTIRTRREDRLLLSMQYRSNRRAYTRGVHKGVRVDPTDYLWPEDFGPMTGLEFQAQGLKWTAQGSGPSTHLTNDGKHGPRGAESLLEDRSTWLRTLAPGWG